MFKLKNLGFSNYPFGEICRLCGEKSAVLLDIFDPGLDLLERLHSVIPVIMTQEKLPNKICEGCSKDLETASKLIEKAAKTSEMLKTCLEYKLFDKNGPVRCDICSKVFTNMEIFDSHVEHHKKTTKDVVGAKPTSILVVCSDCGFAFGDKIAYEDHKAKKKFSCRNCKFYSFSRCSSNCHRCESDSKAKKKSVKEEKKVKDEFMKKIKVGDETLWECEICEKVVTTKMSLQGHLRIHSEERPYECEFCANRFRLRTNLTQHLLTHTKAKNFACPVCGKRFARKSFVRTHMRSHTGEKPFACHICNYRFSQSGDRNRHIARHYEKQNQIQLK